MNELFINHLFQVKNRIDVQEVVAHGRHLNRRVNDRRHQPTG